MAQSLFSCNCSNLHFQRLQSSLISTTCPLRPMIVAAPPRRPTAPIRSATPPTFVIEPTSTSQEDTESIDAEGDSLSQTNTGPNHQISPQSNIPSWEKIVLGAVIVLGLPFYSKALKMRDVTKSVDSVIEMIEIVAEEAKKAAKEVAQALPNGRVKRTVIKLERIASMVNKKAAFADSVIDQVDDAAAELDVKLQPIIDVREMKTNDGAVANTVATTAIPQDGLQRRESD